jgi:hypothetical protein
VNLHPKRIESQPLLVIGQHIEVLRHRLRPRFEILHPLHVLGLISNPRQQAVPLRLRRPHVVAEGFEFHGEQVRRVVVHAHQSLGAGVVLGHDGRESLLDGRKLPL